MKNFSKILVSVICLAAFFTSCVKEEIRIREEIQFDVNLTRAGTTSDQQGDQIQDIMIWAFDLNDQMNCVGWRQYTPPTTTYTSLSLHVPAKTCGNNGGQYRLVALLNRNTFKDAAGNVIPLGRNTTYNDLISGKFVSADLMSSNVSDSPETTGGTPAVMPISHWMDVGVEQTNTHDAPANASNWSHLSVDMPVYRTVAKSQFLMAKKGTNASFDLKVISLKLINNAMPTEGMILSSVENVTSATQPAWFNSQTPTIPSENAAVTYTLVDAATDAAKAVAVSKSLENHPAPANGGTVTQDFLNANYANYNLIGSHFIYETTGSCEYKDNVTTAPTGNGYYYEVIYEVDGNEYTRCVGINSQIVRNHDYQVRALVDAGGKLSLSLVVDEWDESSHSWSYTDVVECTKKLTWSEGTNIQEAENDTNVQEVILPKSGDRESQTATCSFTISAPVDAAYWMASFVRGDIDAFKFVTTEGEVSTVKGKIGEAATLTIRTTNHQVDDTKMAYLDIVVVTNDGRTLSANSALMPNLSYRIVQELTKQNN